MTPPTGGQAARGGDNDRSRLSRIFESQTRSATPDQRAAVSRWQAKDRYYGQVQRAAQGHADASDDALKIVDALQDLALPLSEDVQVWRGIRSISETFRANIRKLRPGDRAIANRFLSTSISADVARDEFTSPGEDAAILKITAKAGVAAVWLPPIGDADMAYQGELLFLPGHMLRILAVDTSGGTPVIEVEVSDP